MSIAELRKDEEELARLIGEATRARVKGVLVHAKAEVDKEIVNLEMKERLAAERQALAAGQDVPSKRYVCELTEYAWDQSDKFVKLFVTLDGVQNTDEANVNVTFTVNSMQLHVSGVANKDYNLAINNLLQPIDVEKSYRKVKNGMIAIYIKKQKEGIRWEHLTTIHRRLKEKSDNDLKSDPENPQDALVNIMKKMYNSGDSKTKQMIAKAWTESQEKAHTGQGGGMPEMGGMGMGMDGMM